MIRFLIRPTDPRLLILSQISSETNRFTGHFDLLPRISRTVTSRTSDPLLIPSFSFRFVRAPLLFLSFSLVNRG